MRRRLYINLPPYSGPIGSMAHYSGGLCEAFSRSGYEVIFCSVEGAAIGDDTISVPPRLRTRFAGVNMLILYLIMLYRILKDGCRDDRILNISQEFIFPFFLGRSVNIIHDAIQMFYPRNKKIRWLLKFNWALARRARLNIADSIATADDIKEYGVSARVIYAFFEIAGFRDFTATAGSDPNIVFDAVWCGTAAYHKNLKLYLDLCKQHPERKFSAVLAAAYMDEARALGIPPNVSFHGSISANEYMRLVYSSRMLVSTSLKEGYGMPPMEAALLGVPLLLSDIPVFREIFGRVAHFHDLTLASINSKFAELIATPVSRELSEQTLQELLLFQGKPAQFVAAVSQTY